MRFRLASAVLLWAALTVGCGGSSGPVKPAQATEEQKHQYRDVQEKVDAEESQHQRTQGVP